MVPNETKAQRTDFLDNFWGKQMENTCQFHLLFRS
jgi:hypothetical protein